MTYSKVDFAEIEVSEVAAFEDGGLEHFSSAPRVRVASNQRLDLCKKKKKEEKKGE